MRCFNDVNTVGIPDDSYTSNDLRSRLDLGGSQLAILPERDELRKFALLEIITTATLQFKVRSGAAFSAFDRGGPGVNFFRAGGNDAGVDRSRDQGSVAEHFLAVADTGPALEHTGRTRMT